KKQEDEFVKKMRDALDKMNKENDEKGASMMLSSTSIPKEDIANIRRQNVMDIINDYYEKTNIKSRNQNYLIGFLRSSKLIALPNRLSSGLENYITMD